MLARVREKEIMDWVQNNIKKWVAVDDLNMKKLKNFVPVTTKMKVLKNLALKIKL